MRILLLIFLLLCLLIGCVVEISYQQTVRVGTVQPRDTVFIDTLNFER